MATNSQVNITEKERINIRTYISNLIKAKGMTASAVATEAKSSKSTLSMFLKGSWNPTDFRAYADRIEAAINRLAAKTVKKKSA